MDKSAQKGVALLTSLVFLVITMLLAVTSVQSSRMDERISSNYRASTLALQAAEAGVTHVIKHVSDEYDYTNTPECTDDDEVLYSVGEQDFGGAGMPNRTYAAQLRCLNKEVFAYGYGYIYSDGDEVSRRGVKVKIQPAAQQDDPRFLSGILSGGNIEVNGKSTIVGNVHANGNVDLKQLTDDTVGTITASGTVSSNDLDDGTGYDPDEGCSSAVCAASGVDPIDIPDVVIDDFISDFYDGGGEVVVGEDVFMEVPVSGGECNLDIDGDQGGVLYYCNGDLNLSGSFNNATIVAGGTINHGGASELGEIDGEDVVDTLIAATGDIVMNGSDDSYAVFFANGSMTQNGSSQLYGSIVVGGNVTRNGGIEFTDMEDVDNSYLPKLDVDGRVLFWAEVDPS